MTKLVTIFGGSGFVGRYIARRMAARGWRLRIAVRETNEAHFLRTYGVVGQVEPVFCNIRDDESVRRVTASADAVVNCVGLLAETGKNTFRAIQDEGAARVARMAKEQGVERFVQVSAIGADEDAPSEYGRTKAAGERAVREHMPGAVILRPSVIFGAEDEFFNRFGQMARRSPVLPLVGASTRFQPVFVDDVAQAVQVALTQDVEAGIYELGGPDVATFRELMRQMLDITRRRAVIVDTPMSVARAMGKNFDRISGWTRGVVQGPLTLDQVKNLGQDNVVSGDHRTFADLGIDPTPMDQVLPEYLWRFRPQGQYAAISESARNLRH